MPNYTYATLQNALDALAARLYDKNYVFWPAAELTGYILEALRTWNALSLFHRVDFSFLLQAGTWWYDLTQQTNTVVPFAAMQNDLLTVIETHLLEPPTTSYPLTWTGSSQYALSDLLSALQLRENETLGRTGCVVSRSLVSAPIGGSIVLPDSVIDIWRVAWLPSGGGYVNRPLRQSDAWANRAFSHGYLQAAPRPPEQFMQSTEPPISFDVDSTPPVAGNYELLTVSSDPHAWATTANAVVNVPTDWCWVFKWGALFDLMSREYLSKDNTRATYCLQRFTEGLKLLAAQPMVLALTINGVPMALDAVRNGDDFNPLWQAAAAGAPQAAYVNGNMLAIYPQPDANPYTAKCSVCQNAPVPAVPSDFIQVSREDYDTVIDYAQHLAMFKAGGAEFIATVPLYQKLQQRAALYNGKLKEMGFFESEQQDISSNEEQRRPRFDRGAAEAA